jgi:membrane-bound lytic murein transglycosylase A
LVLFFKKERFLSFSGSRCLGFSSRAAAVLAVALVCGCEVAPTAPKPTPLVLEPASFADLPGWSADHISALLPGFKRECRRLALLPADTDLGGQGLASTYGGQAGDWLAPCHAAADVLPGSDAAMRAFFAKRFTPYRIATPALVTGYFEPEAEGSLHRGGVFQTPLLSRPTDLVQGPPPAGDPLGPPAIGRRVAGTLVPYWTRAEIEAGAAGAATHPLFWLRDPVDLFFLQVQGSGRIRLPDGSVLRVTYDGRNGRAYTPIGRVLVAEHALAPEDVSMQSIRAWLAAHPDQAKRVMDTNEDFVFFRPLRHADSDFGPPGAMGVDLTPGRSAAVDRHFVPLGVPLFIDTTDPVSHAPWQRLVLAQDLGTDILGPARADIFLGSGFVAAQTAGLMRQTGTIFVLLPRP